MKIFLSSILTSALIILMSQISFGQCTNGTQFPGGAIAAPTGGATTTISTCNYTGEYSNISGVTATTNYQITSSIATDYITVRQGTSGGAVIASGVQPLNWTSTVAGNYYVHYNDNAACGFTSACRTTSITHFTGPMAFSGITVTQASTIAVPQSALDREILRVEVVTTGGSAPLSLTSLNLNLAGTTSISDISGVKVYFTGNSTSFSTATLFGTVAVPATTATFVNITGSQTLVTGSNNFWIAYDISPTAVVGNVVDGTCRQAIVNSLDRLSNTVQNPAGSRPIVAVTPTPGNNGTTNLTAWWKADVLTNGNVNTWTTSYPSGGAAIAVSDPGTPFPQATNIPASSIFNYNSVVDFNGNVPASEKFLSNTSAQNLLTNQSSGDKGTFFVVYAQPNTGGFVLNDCVVGYKNGNHGIQMRSWGRLAIGAFNSADGSRDFTPDVPTKPIVISYKGNKSAAGSLTAFRNDKIFTNNPVPSSALMWTGLTFGVKRNETNTAWNEHFSGYLSEVIFFNEDLSNANINKVNSYVGVKYSITLDNTGGGAQGDYTGTNNALIWDASVSPAYHNDVIGIGRDDAQGLLQKQSHTFDDITRIYRSTLAATNVANTGTFSTNVSYVLAGHNNDVLYSTTASNAEVPASCGLYSRLAREWKVTKTNSTDNFSFDVKLSAGAIPSSVTIADLRFLVDDDGNFANGGTTCYFNGDAAGTVITYSNPVITVSNINGTHIANNTTKYITIGSILVTTPLAVELISYTADCESTQNVLDWSTATETNNDYFTIEKSTNGVDFYVVATIDGNGTTTSLSQYRWTEESTSGTAVYYRLKQTDFNGSTQNHGIRAVTCKHSSDFSIYPNPFENNFTINLGEKVTYPLTVEVFDNSGRIIHTEIIIADNTTIVLGENLSAGTYIVKVFNESTKEVGRLIKIK